MNRKINYETAAEPTMFITKGKQRVKQQNNAVFLKDGEEFELELFNPLTYKILAKISINGNYLQSGIVLRPGERVFLERHLDESKKFVFSVYSVDVNDPIAQKAIANNGDVEVEFYQEAFDWPITHVHVDQWARDNQNTGNPVVYPYWDISCTSQGIHTSGNLSENISFSTCSDSYNLASDNPANIETGRVDKGSSSDQDLQYDSTKFCSFYLWKKSWKILPLSRKAYVKEELSVYCTNCGAKRKKDSFKFCPHCGNKF